VGGGRYSLRFSNGNQFGSYERLANQWIRHLDLGYEHVVPADGDGIYMYDLKSGHRFYTDTGSFPYLYDSTLKTWLYYVPDKHNTGRYTADPRYFANMTTGQVFTM